LGGDDGFFRKASDAPDSERIREAAIKINVIDALESFSSAHSETIEEILNWPWQKFELLYEAFVKREQASRAFQERTAYITGLLANTNLDDGKQTKARLLESVDIDYENTLRSIYNIIIGEELESPLFQAIKIPGQEIPEQATDSDRTTEKLDIDVDQGG
jgi:hypothetical protein